MDDVDKNCILTSRRFRGRNDYTANHSNEYRENGNTHLSTTYSETFTPKKLPRKPIAKAMSPRVHVPFEGMSTYRQDYIMHELPKQVERLYEQPKRVPFVGSTTYQSDFGEKTL
ncbi:hypothetical protein BdWA1_001314 [Babesia duncani]|uniref:Uncharacterized protein n=1 Tax=Babesia duncani TaxID=323732 RepID=A0AAD9PNZ5_9APIC|nr:hypothetical protein BdWA1_001314 [Babesia duncani]